MTDAAQMREIAHALRRSSDELRKLRVAAERIAEALERAPATDVELALTALDERIAEAGAPAPVSMEGPTPKHKRLR